ncbi:MULTISPECIES: helix-turn-helix domain-containing protein [Thermomonas]|jgi:cytoskeleton protein RodZ|uniref:helix-turn-helix domain-containing protein n=1 Tax=Thermomonas TaxID=141948 RepID=UPI000406D8A1|nr:MULTISPECIES: helix-turn-helix domain-containing protein [Thermomonas]
MTSSQQSDQAHEALAGCGERLRIAREAAGLSIDDVAARLRMPHRVVRSLENEDWSRLGAPVFVRGQVRSYSRLLGLTTAPMMDALMVGQVEPTKLVSRTHIPKAQWWAEQIGRRLVYIVLTLSLAIPVWVATRQHLAGTAEGVAALDAPADPAAPAEPEADRTPRTVVASMTPVAANAQPAAVKALAADAEIVVRTSAKTWLEVVANDGSTLAKELLPAGAERRYAASQVRRMTIGNASAVALESRGRPVDALANARANVARFEVSSDGSLVASN